MATKFRQLIAFFSFISIAAGSNHLLALTSRGRTYAHPVNKDANSHGQLGLQKIEIPAPSGLMDDADRSRVAVELVPQSPADPHAKTSPLPRESSPTVASEHPDVIDDRHIRFSDALLEIPSLRGVNVSQIAAGGRSSFVNTSSGRVLGWGANEHGWVTVGLQLVFGFLRYLLAISQIGLGSGITLDTIIIPTEIDLARNLPVSTRSRCLSVIAG